MSRIHLCGAMLVAFLVSACGPSQGVDSPPCTMDVECDDGNPCTDDVCLAAGTCQSTANGASCDDGSSCTVGDVCLDTVCVGTENVCPCVDDVDCNPFDDDDLCNGRFVCSDDAVCVVDRSSVVTCDSSADTECTRAACVPSTGQCEARPVANGEPCSDGDDCTAADACQSGQCVGGAPPPECADTCPAVAPVEEAPLPVQSSANMVESTSVNGFSDDYVYNQAGTIKVGTRRDWGGSIVFFGMHNGQPGVNNTNAIDSADTGREVQVALYDVDRWYQSCAWNASCNANPSPTQCPQQMTWLGWNPVQGGNRCNNGSGVDDVSLQAGAATVTATPLFWNPNWDRTDCESNACNDSAINKRRSDVQIEQRVRFVRPNVVELSYKLTNLAGLDHASSVHEFPTVYSSFGKSGTPDLHRLFNSSQQQVAIDDHPPADAAFRYKNFTSPGGWVSLQNTNLDYGVGLYYENGLTSYQAWQADDPDFNNFRGLFAFAIPAYGQVRARSYLILGSLGTVAAEATWLAGHLPPFGSLDGPATGAAVSGTVPVHGWAMDNKGVASVRMTIDGGAPIALAYGSSRPDVCKVWPGYPACASGNVGYSGSFDASAISSGECGSVVEISAVDGDGNARVIARRRVLRAP